jgi:hypothetical protein
MLCFLCGKKIGLLRSLVDQQYCSVEHRKEARLASAQAMRDEEELEPWSVARRRDKDKKGLKKGQVTAGKTASIFAFLTVGGLLLAALLLPGPGPGPGFPAVSLDPGVKRGLIERVGDSVGELVRSSAPVTLQHDFSKGLTDWATVNVKGGGNIDDPRDWIGGTKSALNHTESLHLWKRSTALQNYQMEFQGEMQRNSLSWAFRAADGQNYYATRLVITKPGPQPNAALVRYAMVDGREFDKVKLPLPLTLERGVNYNVRVTVQDDRFITYLNSQVISSWSDKRLHRGGVGFFEDAEDPQKVAWVSLSERDSFIGRMLAHFSLFVVPGEANSN